MGEGSIFGPHPHSVFRLFLLCTANDGSPKYLEHNLGMKGESGISAIQANTKKTMQSMQMNEAGL